jgi:hypothetical protein
MRYAILSLVVVFLTLPELVSAAGLVPCGDASAGEPMCEFCHFVMMANEILLWLIGLLFVVFAVVIAIGGFGLVTSGGRPEAKNEAKSKVINGLIGLVIVLAAWLLVDTMLRALLPGDDPQVNGRPWNAIECTGNT